MTFYEATHEYIEDGVKYTPVTYFLKSHEPYVDWNAELVKKAKKLGITPQELRKQWDEKRDKAAAKGTAYHAKKEQQMLEQQGIIRCNVLCPVMTAPTIEGIRNDDSMRLQDNTIYTEKMIWNKKYKVCGTADLVEVVNGVIHVKDYKTNEKLDMESYKHPVLGSKKLKFPVNHLDACNFNIYQLQINTYMYFLLQQNRAFKMGDMEIHHVVFDGDGEEHETIIYKVANLQTEVRSMLEAFALRIK